MAKRLSIDPVTRLEGHGRIELFLDDDGKLTDSYLVVPEIRGFEAFLEGRPIEEMAHITPRICGVCPEAHHAAAAKAADAALGVEVPVTAELIRRLQYAAFMAGDHATHFYALAGPDFVVGPDADPAERNLLGVIGKVGLDFAKDVIRMRKEGHEVAEMLGGRRIHPVGMIPGGQSKAVGPEDAARLREIGAFMVDFSQRTNKVFEDVVLGNKRYTDMVLSPEYSQNSYYIGLVDDEGRWDAYGGRVRVVAPDGSLFGEYDPARYLDHVAERTESWSYLKFPYLKEVGWAGLVDGKDSGVMRSGPLGMLNVATSMRTPLAQAEFERFFSALGGRPVHATLAYHWARVIEMLQSAEIVAEIAADERLTSPDVRATVVPRAGEGVGTVEAPRGLLTHHYVTDDDGIVRKANLIVGTTHNHAAIQLSVRSAAEAALNAASDPAEANLNLIEMALRAYDPCFGCATHALPGKMPLELVFHGPGGSDLGALIRDRDGHTRWERGA